MVSSKYIDSKQDNLMVEHTDFVGRLCKKKKKTEMYELDEFEHII